MLPRLRRRLPLPRLRRRPLLPQLHRRLMPPRRLCRMQFHDAVKTSDRFKVGHLDPLQIAERAFKVELRTKEEKRQKKKQNKKKKKGLSEEQFAKQKLMEGRKKIDIVEYIKKYIPKLAR
uniref:Uncharacterized protein n=1 Tax=Arundo donax TaxID=35708 RepID=A0A0A8YQN5_ARUDO